MRLYILINLLAKMYKHIFILFWVFIKLIYKDFFRIVYRADSH